MFNDLYMIWRKLKRLFAFCWIIYRYFLISIFCKTYFLLKVINSIFLFAYITKLRGGSRINFSVLQSFIKKSITVRCAKSKGLFCRSFWPKLHWNRDIMALAWVAKISKQRAAFNWWHHGLVKKQLQHTY